jgi:DNA-binding winged helix-turn-helix (wHTH) protein
MAECRKTAAFQRGSVLRWQCVGVGAMYSVRLRQSRGNTLADLSAADTASARKIVRFGVFEVDLRAGELRKHGVKLKLQGKPFQVLNALLERPGDVVTREELQKRLWPGDVFIDFESGLNTAANRLRSALSDAAESPRYVETLPGIGYRFVAPITVVDSEPPGREGNAAVAARPVVAAPAAPRDRHTLTVVAVSLIAAITVGSFLALRSSEEPLFQFRQVTFRRGQVWGARFGPDGRAILYTASWDNGPRRRF